MLLNAESCMNFKEKGQDSENISLSWLLKQHFTFSTHLLRYF